MVMVKKSLYDKIYNEFIEGNIGNVLTFDDTRKWVFNWMYTDNQNVVPKVSDFKRVFITVWMRYCEDYSNPNFFLEYVEMYMRSDEF
jgi:hypothetical protein